MTRHVLRRVFEKTTYWTLAAIAAGGIGWGMGQCELVPAQAEIPHATSPMIANNGRSLITHFHEDTNTNRTHVIVIDPISKQMAVYHVDLENGTTELKSARNLKADLQLQSYNSGPHRPSDMQKLLDRN